MESKSSRKQLLVPLVLAFLMVFTVLGGMTPEAEAAATGSPRGKVQITTEPDFEATRYIEDGATGSNYYPWNAQPPSPTAQPPQLLNNPLTKYPEHPAVVYAKPKGGDIGGCGDCFQRTVRVAFNDLAAVNTIDFIYYIRDGVSYPVCGGGTDVWGLAMDPCMPKAIKWVPEFSYATRPGWTVTANAENDVKTPLGTDNPAARILTFQSATPNPKDSSMGGSNLPNALDVVIAFRVEGSPNGDDGMAFGTFPQTPADEFHIQVNVYNSGDVNVPFETTCPANNSAMFGVNPQATFSCVLTNPPFDGPALPGFPGKFMPDPITSTLDCGFPGGACAGSPSLVIRMDTLPPEVREPSNGDARLTAANGGPIPCVCSFYSQDLDHNGHIDRFVVSFTEPVNPQTFDFRQFSISTKGRDRAYSITNAFFEQQDPNGLGLCVVGLTTPPVQTPPLVPLLVRTMGSSCRVNFIVAEMPFYDTGDRPNLIYPCTGCGQTLTDRAGNLLKKISGSTIVAVDRAPPVLYSVYALDAAHNGGVEAASTQMHAFFSENVVGSGCVDPLPGPPATCGSRPVRYDDLCYMNNLNTMPTDTDIIGNPGPANLQGCFSLDQPYDTVSAVCQPVPKCRYFDFVSHTAVASAGTVGVSADGWKMVIVNMADPVDANHRLMFGTSDVHPFQGDMLGVRADNHGISRSCQSVVMFEAAPCDGNVRDLHDNGGWYRSGGAPQATVAWPRPPANAHVTFPMVKAASVDISNPDCNPAQSAVAQPGPSALTDTQACHYWLKLQFNGPVRGPNGPASCDTTTAKAPKPFYPCNLDIATASGTGQGPQGFLGPAPPTGTGTSVVSQAPYYLAADSDTAILQMDHAARAVDVGLTPSRVKIFCNTIYATPGSASKWSLDPTATTLPGVDQQVGVLPCDDPDLYYGPGEDTSGAVLKADIDIVDRTPPRILEAKTVDADRNGYLDGIQLTFSEPVGDATFCGGGDAALSAPTFCADTETGSGSGYITFSRWDSREEIRGMVDPQHQECRAVSGSVTINGVAFPYTQGFRWDTGLVANDNTGIIGLVNTTTQSDGSFVTRVLDCKEYFRGAFTGVRWTTDSLLHITTPVPGLFSDLASHPYINNEDIVSPPGSPPVPNPNLLPRVCQFESHAMTAPTAPFNQLQNHPSAMCDMLQTTVDSVRVTDGAPPVLWRAETYDTPVLDSNGVPKPSQKYYENVFGDGTIDGYRLTFSEPVNDATFNAKDWHVEGLKTLEFTPCSSSTPIKYTSHDIAIDTWVPPGKSPMRTYETDLNPADPLEKAIVATKRNDDQFILLFTPAKEIFTRPGVSQCKELHAVYDTGSKPELTGGTAPMAPMFLRDRVGNPMVGFDTFAVQEQDDAGPQIVRIEGFVGTNHISVRFSESVDDGAHSGLVRDDFQYFDKNIKDVAGLSSTEPVQHDAGERNATLLMGQILTASDQSSDKIGARFCRIFETAPSVPSFERKCVPSYPRALLPENDTFLPGAISGFRIVAELTNANSLTASWTAPGDDGVGGGAVASYTCYVSDKILIGNETNANGISFEYDPDSGSLAEPGRTQTVKIIGLDPEKSYFVACEALDDLGNAGPLSQSEKATTTRDVTPPTGTITISSDTHPEGVATDETTAAFKWTAITKEQEPESTIRYHYALNQNPNYVVLATDGATTDRKATQLVPADGEWYFHVAGVSGGGSTLTAHYHLIVGVTPLSDADVIQANDLVKTTPYRQEDVRDGETVILNNVTWELPPLETPPGLDITGIEIWRNDQGIFRMINGDLPRPGQPNGCMLTGDYDSLKVGYCHDTSPGADADSKYKVTMVFAKSPFTQPAPTTGYSELVDTTPAVVPPWVWILAGIALALILSGLVIFFILRSRARVDATGGTAYSWESANPELLGIDEATGLPVHEVRCPSCNNPFQAVGALPLPVTCPTCGTTGELD